MQLIHTNAELTAALKQARLQSKRIGFVPTMGALHLGHESLVKLALEQTDFVVVSVFVNPLQFGAGEDFERYPRAIGVDASVLTDLGVDVLYAPSVNEIYPPSAPIRQLSAGELGRKFEGNARPDHFDGMLTVVSRLFDLVQPDKAFFGQKDAQQVALVRGMLAEQISSAQRPPIQLVVGPTIRDEHGLALSSRNAYLSAHELEVARTISASLKAASSFSDREQMLAAAKARLSPEAKLDYLELVDPDSFEVLTQTEGKRALLIIAALVGSVRLIDNLVIDRTA
jgi:pantoate--beta-alanine ligase